MVPLSGELKIYEARSLADYLFLRKLRNAVRRFMTNDTSRITLFQQICFYRKKPPHIRLYIARLRGQRVGYLLLREVSDTTWVTEAVEERFRGQKIATALLQFAQAQCPRLTAEIRMDNEASARLHVACGFRLESEASGTFMYGWQRGAS